MLLSQENNDLAFSLAGFSYAALNRPECIMLELHSSIVNPKASCVAESNAIIFVEYFGDQRNLKDKLTRLSHGTTLLILLRI